MKRVMSMEYIEYNPSKKGGKSMKKYGSILLLVVILVVLPLFGQQENFSISDRTFEVVWQQLEKLMAAREVGNPYQLWIAESGDSGRVIRLFALPSVISSVTEVRKDEQGYFVRGEAAFFSEEGTQEQSLELKINSSGRVFSLSSSLPLLPLYPLSDVMITTTEVPFMWKPDYLNLAGFSAHEFELFVGRSPKSEEMHPVSGFLSSMGAMEANVSLPGMKGTVYWKLVATDLYGRQVQTPVSRFVYMPSEAPLGRTMIEGRVLDASNRQPLPNVEVIVLRNSQAIATTISSEEGSYAFELQPGEYTLSFQKGGYVPVTCSGIQPILGSTRYMENVALVAATTMEKAPLSGKLVDPTKPDSPIAGAKVQVRPGMNNMVGDVVSETTTDMQGKYTTDPVDPGSYTVSFQSEGYIETHTNTSVTGEQVTVRTASLSPVLEEDEVRIILEWDEMPEDLDAHLTTLLDSGEKLHLFYPFAESRGGSPWPGFLVLDLDNTTGREGPETITIKQPANGEYLYSVLDYTNQGNTESTEISDSNAMVRVLRGNREIDQYFPPWGTDMGKGFVWNVVKLQWLEGMLDLTPSNTISGNPSSIWLFPYLSNLEIDPVGVSEPEVWGTNVSIQANYVKNEGTMPGIREDAQMIKILVPGYEMVKDKFQVFEDGRAQGFELVTQESIKTALDIVFIVDLTGSMGEEISGVKQSLSQFVRYLNELGLMIRIGVLPYDDAAPAIANSIPNDTWLNLTDSREPRVQAYINALGANGGGDEVPYQAIRYAAENASWMEYAEKVILLITDELQESTPPSSSSKNQLIQLLNQKGISASGVFSVGESEYSRGGSFTSWDDPREIAVSTGGFVFYTDSQARLQLDQSGIVDPLASAQYLIYLSDSQDSPHVVSIYFEEDKDHQGSWSQQLEY